MRKMQIFKIASIFVAAMIILIFIFTIYTITMEQSRRDIIGNYVDFLKQQIFLDQLNMTDSVAIVQGFVGKKWSPSTFEKAFICPDANSLVIDSRKKGENFIPAGNFSNPNFNVAVYGTPLPIIVIDSNILPIGIVPRDSQFVLEYTAILLQRSTKISLSWLECGEAFIAVPKVIK